MYCCCCSSIKTNDMIASYIKGIIVAETEKGRKVNEEQVLLYSMLQIIRSLFL